MEEDTRIDHYSSNGAGGSAGTISVQGLTKTYGQERAVDAITFDVRPGEVVGFLGPNGAGKTTTMKVITGYLNPTEGSVLVDGMDVREDTLAIRRRIGYLPESTPLYHEMVTYDYLEFVAAMREIPKERRGTRIVEMTHACGLHDVLSKKIDTLSKGYRQRVGLAQAMIHDPPILILDEPTSGLDPNQIVEIRELIRTIGRKKTVILSTHILPEVEASCDRVLIINNGKIVADGTPQLLQESFAGGHRLRYGVRGDGDTVASVLTEHDITVVEQWSADDEARFLLSARRDVRDELFQLAVSHSWALTELYREEGNLEDVFRQLTSAAPQRSPVQACPYPESLMRWLTP